VQDLVTQLVEKSLVILDAEHDRYRMLETVRQYGVEKLTTGEEAATRCRFVHYCVDLCERAAPELTGSQAPRWLELLDQERENLLAAHAACERVEGGGALDLRLVRAVRRYCSIRGLFNLLYDITVEAIARSDPSARDIARCRALSDAGQYALRVGRPHEALKFLEESLAIAREIGDQSRVAVVLQPIGVTYLSLDDVETARRYLGEGLELARQGGDKREIAAALSAMEQIHRVVGDLDAAEAASRDVLATMRELDDKQNVGVALTNLAIVSILRGSYAEATQILREILEINDQLGGTPFHQWILEVAAGIAVGAGIHVTAARLHGAAAALSEASGRQHEAADAAFVASIREQTHRALGDRGFDGAFREGRAMVSATTLQVAREISRRR